MTNQVSAMTALWPRVAQFIPVYFILLLALALLGAQNQRLLRYELNLMEQGEQARQDVASYRAAAAVIDGPLAVARWAQENGMVPVPEVERVEHLLPLPAPPRTSDASIRSGLEVRTVWR